MITNLISKKHSDETNPPMSMKRGRLPDTR